mmetsp:Transcript_8997/g.17900  ORF Transcript_8997/g.17900 Transcript_8997/m.17900 type:complete len:224 (+) Transcript_8997:1197-1868(+)
MNMFFSNSSSNAQRKKKLLRKQQRDVNSLIRELDRERLQLQQQEKALIADLKKFAKEQQLDAAKVTAKSIVRNRGAVTKLYQLKSQLQAVSLRMAEVTSTQAMTDAMKGTTKALGAMNKKMMHNDTIVKILKDFEKQNQVMQMTNEQIEASTDTSTLEDEDEEEALVSSVFEELQLNDMMAGMALHVPRGTNTANKEGEEEEEEGGGEDIQALLERHRKLIDD